MIKQFIVKFLLVKAFVFIINDNFVVSIPELVPCKPMYNENSNALEIVGESSTH